MTDSVSKVIGSNISPLRKLVNHAGIAPSQNSTDASSSQTAPDFRELMALMMMGFNMQGSESGSSGIGNLIAPLMFNLLEQLLAQEVHQEEPAQPIPQNLPLEGRFTQMFKPDHSGVDIAIPVGTPVHSTMEGEVVYAGWNNQGYGNLVIVENGPYRTYYAHLSEIPVQVGQKVSAGLVVGLSGNTGNSTGPHLHYEVRLNGEPVDPMEFVSPEFQPE